MKTNSEGKWEPQIINNAINWLESDREQVAKILQENITFSGQLGDYVIHGAIEKLLEWRKLYSDQQNKELRELLGKCRDSLSGTVVNLGFDSPMDYQIAEQLIDDISNALNP